MTRSTLARRPVRFAAAILIAGSALLGIAPSAHAAATATVTVSPATADPDYATKVTLHGTGFQSIQGGFGGVYVLFGTVSGTWQPSKGGVSGQEYVYVQDSETKDNHGYQRFVAFPGDPTGYAANGGQVKADGTWNTDLIIPGATFPAKGRDGSVEQIDCRQVQCGIITIGAHGVVNAHNETFTPVSFAVPQQAVSHAAATTAAAAATVAAPMSSSASSSTAPTGAASTSDAGGVVIGGTGTWSPSVAPASATQAAAVETSTSSSNTNVLVIAMCVLIFVAGILGGMLLRRRPARGPKNGGAA